MNRTIPFAMTFSLSLVLAGAAEAACVNRYVARTERQARINLTIITGKLTFAEAEKLAGSKDMVVEWTDSTGKLIAKPLPGTRAVRPMPVACDDKPSGSVLSMTFLRPSPPTGTIYLRLGEGDPVAFEQQGN